MLFSISVSNETYGQSKIYPTTATEISDDERSCGLFCLESTVQDKDHALADNDEFSRLYASPGILGPIGKYGAELELNFGSNIPANTWSYVRIGADESLLKALLGGSLGELLSDVLGAVLLGNQEIEIQARNSVGAAVLTRTSTQGFDTDRVRLVQDGAGNYFLAIKPSATYDRIRIINSSTSVAGLGAEYTLDVFNAFYLDSEDPCGEFRFTSFDGEGISLDLLDLGGAGVTNAGNAIDADANSHSEISIGTLGVGASMYQNINFGSLSSPEDYFKVKLSIANGGVLTTDLLGGIEVKAYNGANLVFVGRLEGGLISGLDLLSLLQNGTPVTIPFGPGVPFDRITVGYNSLVSLNALSSSPIWLYDVQRYGEECPDPDPLPIPPVTEPPFNNSDCAMEVLDWDNANFPLNAIDGNNDSYAVLSASTGTALKVGAYGSHIELKYAAPVAAGETSYVRIEFENDELNALLGGSLGSGLADLLGSVTLGDHYFTVTPKTAGGTDIYTASSATGFDNQDVRVVQDESGRFYIAFTADQAYQSVRIDHYLAALIGLDNTATMHVFSMCRETEFDLCEQATFTDFDGDGIALDLLDITKGGVFNPQNAIDGNSSNYSTINLGLAGIGASVYQNIYFKTKSQTTDALRLRVQLDQPGILNLDLAGSYRVILYNGNDEVFNESLQDALINNLDLLGLLNSGGIQELLIEPGMEYDRVSFGLESAVAINTSAPIRLYGISRVSAGCPDPDVADPPYLSPVCAEELIDAAYADNLANLFDGNFNSFATINSKGGVLGTAGAFAGHITLGFGSGVLVPAGTTSYMRIDTDSSILDALLGGSVGSVLSDLLNTVILGNHYFNVIANDASGTPIFTASSSNSFAGFNDQVKIVQDALGRYYLAITPNVAYNSITIEDHTDALLLGQDNSINIYGLCYDSGAEACATGFTTSFDGSGITVDAGSIGSYGVTNAERILDNNNNDDYSEISLGTLGVAGSIQQNIQFRQTIPADGAFKIKLGIGSGVLDAGVFGRIDVVGYLEGVEVYDETLDNAVLGSVNLVDLFNNGANEEIRISPGVAIDEIAIRLRSLVSVTAVPNVRLYYILQDCETPDFQAWESYVIDGDPSLTTVSGGETIVYTIHVRNTGTVPMTDYVITDAIPAHTTYIDGSGGTESAGVVSFENLDIAPGATETVSFSVLVDDNLTDVGFVSNVALVKSLPEDPGTETYPAADNENPTDPDESGDTGTDIPVDPIFSAEIWKSITVDGDAGITSVSGGETLEYTVFIRNTGNQDLTDLSISDALPNGVTYVSGGALVGNDVNFSLPGLAVGATSTVGSFTATVDEDLTGIDEIINIAVANSADLTAPIESYPPLDNSNPTEPDTAADPGTVLDVTPVHAVDFDKIGLSNNSESDGKAIVGDIITYTLTVSNTGNKTLTGISVVDQIPANATVVDNGGGTAGAGTLTFDIASLAVGAMQEFTFTIQVESVIGSDPIINNAEAFYTDAAGGNTSETAQHSMPTECMTIDAGDIALTADQSAICIGESTILHASLNGISIPNPEFRWYQDASLTGAFYAGADYEVSPTASTTYYVTVVAEGYCFSTPAATTSITVNELPDVPSTSSNITISEGFGTVLTASIDPMPADVEIVWYAEGGAELATGDSYDTGVLSAGVYTFYAGTRNTLTGCISIDTTAVIVTVEPVTTDGDCTVANAQNNGTYFLCLPCSVENPGNAVDGNIDSFSRFVAPAAVTGGVWQELVFGQTGSAGDTIVITLGTGTSLLDLGVLSGLSFESYNGASANGDGGVVDNNLISLRLIGGNSKGEVRFVAGASFDRVRIEYRPLLGLLESGWRIYQAEINYPAPTAITEDVEVCVGKTATLEATPSAGTSLRWYDAETGGTLLASGNSYTTPALTPAGSKTYYIAILREGCADPVRIPVNVTVNPGAAAADIQVAGDTICAGDSFTLSATTSTVTNPVFRFYEDEDLTVEITDLNVSPSTTTTYYVTVSGDGVCENAPGDAAEVVVMVNPNAVDSDININDTVTQCEGEDVVLVPTSSIANPIFTWYYDATKTTPITTDVVFGIPYTVSADGTLTISGLAAGSTTEYFVTVSGDGYCENEVGKSVSVSITNSLDAPEFVVDELEVCGSGTDVTFEISNAAGGMTYTVYDAAVDGNEVTSGISIVGNEIIIASVTSDQEYYVSVMGGSGCESMTRTRIAVSVIPPATAADIQTTDDTICAGDSFTLSATSSTVTNPVFRFYTDVDLSNELTNLTVTPSETTTYYVTVSGDGVCENAPGDAAMLTVTVNPLQSAPTVGSASITITEGFATQLSASAPTGSTVVWYSDTDVELATGPTYMTPPLAQGNYTYYVASRDDATGCESAVRTMITVVVLPANQIDDCTVANAQTVDSDILCLLCFATTPEQAVDGNKNTYGRLTVPVSLLAGSISQTMSFPTMGSTGDSVKIDLGIPGGLADVNLLSRIEIKLLNGNSVVDQYALNESLVNLTVLGGGTLQQAAVLATGSFDRVRISLIGLANVLTSLDIYQANIQFATPTAITEDAEVCVGETATLSATPAAGTSLRWYDVETGGTLLASGNSYTTPALTPAGSKTYYIAILREGCEDPVRIPVNVTVNPGAAAADIQAAGDTICAGDSFTLSATSSTVTNPVFRFYEDADLTVELTDLSVSPATTTTYYVTVTGDGVCENAPGDAAELVVTVNPAATAADIDTMGGMICAGDSFTFSVTSSTVTNPVFRFYEDEDLTVEITDLSVSPATTTTYYVTVSGDGVCENAPGDAATLTVTVNPAASSTDIDAMGGMICAGDSFTFSVTSNTVTNPVFTFYEDADLTVELTDLSVSPATTTTYYVTVSGDGVCENVPGDAAELVVTVNPAATAADIDAMGGTICAGESFTLSATSSTVTNPVFRFYEDADLTVEITDLTVTPTDTTTYYVTVSGDGVCENVQGDAAELVVTVNLAATAADIDTMGGMICVGDSFTLSATSSTVTNPIFRFYEDEDLTVEITDLSVSPATTITYYVTVSGDAVCENAPGDAATLTVTVNLAASSTDIDAMGGTICAGDSFTLSATSSTVTNPIFRFYEDADLTVELTDLSVSPATTTTYYVTVSGDGVCENAPGEAAELVVTVSPVATAADIDTMGGTICAGDSFTLSATSNTVTNPVFTFYEDADLTVEIIDLTVSPATTTTYYVTVSGDGVCENAPGDAAELVVTVNPAATAADIQATGGTICAGDSFTLSATSSTVTNPVFAFYEDADLTVEITDLSVSPATTTTYYVSVSGDGVCGNAPGEAATLTVTVNPAATAADLDAMGGMICAGDSFTLSATSNTVTNPVFTFYEDADLTVELTDLTVTPTATTTYYVTVTGDGVCENAPGDAAELVVTVNPAATAADIQATGGKICAGDSFTLSATSSTVTNPVFAFYEDADLTVEITDLSVSPATTTTYYVSVSGDGVCENAPGDAAELVVTVNPAATAADIDAMGGTICAGDSFTLSATSNTVTNPVFRFYEDADLTVELTDLSVSPATTTTYYVTVSGDGVCENAPGEAATLTVTVNPVATAADIDAMGGTICAGSSFTLSATSSTVTNPVFRFYEDADLTVELTDLSVSPATTTTYYLTVSGDGVCENAPGEAAMLTVTVGREALSSDVQVINAVICEGESTILTATSNSVSNPVFKFYRDEALTEEVIDLNVSPSVTTRYYVTVMGDEVCESKPSEAAHLTVTVRTVSPPEVSNSNQTFCGDTDNPTLASLAISGNGIKWYETSAGGMALPEGTTLMDGVTYYASQTDSVTGCESLERASVTVALTLCDTGNGLQISKVASNATVNPGGEITYTISVTNTASIAMSDITVKDVLDDQLNFVSASDGGSIEDRTVTWSVSSLAADATANVTLTVRVSKDVMAGTMISNIAVVTSPDDPESPKESDPEVVEVVNLTVFTIEKIPNVSEARIGEPVIYSIKVSNISAVVKEQIQVTDTLPVGLRFVDSDQGGIESNGIVTWIIPSLAPGQNLVLSLVTEVSDEAEVGRFIYNTAIVDQLGDEQDPVESDPGDGVLVIEEEDNEPQDLFTLISASKWTEVDSVVVGELVDYTIRLENIGEYTATDILIVDSLPAGTMAMEVSPEGEISENAVSWTIASMEVGEVIELNVKLMVTANEGSIINWLYVSGENFPDVVVGTDPLEVLDPINEVDLTIDKEVSASLIQVNSIFEYKISLTNNSDNTSNEVVVSDVLSPDVEYIGADVSAGTVSYNLETKTLTWNIVSVDPMAVETMMIRVKAISEGTVSNTATAASDDEELVPEDNTDTVSHEQLVFEIPNVFTPNGDGVNDTWMIRGLQEFFQQNELLIVNRWGVEVYKTTNYQSDWNGENLNGGTYFYQFQLIDNQGVSHTKTGYVTIIK